MKTPPFEPVRFVERRGQGDQGGVAHLIRQAMGAPERPMPPLKGRIRHTLRQRSASRRRHLRAVLVSAAIFVSGGVVGAVVQPILRLREQAKTEAADSVASGSPGRRPRGARGPARPPNASPANAALEATPAVPVAALPESRPANPIPAPAPASAQSKAPPEPARASIPATVPAPTAPREPARAPIPAAAPAPARGAPPAEIQEKAVPSVARTMRSPGAHRRGGEPTQIAMREPATSPLPPPPVASQPAPTALQPAPLSPPSIPAPAPSEDASSPPRRLSPIAPSAPAPKPAPSPAQDPAAPPPSEQALVASAIRSLRVQRSPGDALVALDKYQARYPHGSLLAETARLRAEALLLLGERRAALDELSRAPGTGSADDEESRLVRGELAASAGRWQEARRDFDALVTAWTRGPRGEAATSGKLRARFERALWGRACARSQMGDEAGARADLKELLMRFPQGRFATQAAQRLGEPR